MFAEKLIILTLFCHFKRFFFFAWKLLYTSCQMETLHILTMSCFFFVVVFSVDGRHVLLSGEYGQQKCFLKMGFFVLFLCLALEYFGVCVSLPYVLQVDLKHSISVSTHTYSTLYTYMPHTQEAHTLSLVTF